jgi:galactosylceramidase
LEHQLTKVNFWSPVSSYYDCLPAPRSGVVTANTPWSGAFSIEPTLWAVAHFNQFTEPGWRLLTNASRKLAQGGSMLAFAAPNGGDFSIVIETTEARQEQSIRIQAPVTRPLSVWRTDMMEQFVRMEDLISTNGEYVLNATPNCIFSLSTRGGQSKGDGSSPARSAFPLPYHEAFDGYPLNATPRYLADQGGAFEVVNRPDGGRCLGQQVYRPGIDWAKASYAYTVIGDDQWNDIVISARASLVELPEGAAGDRYMGLLARWNPGGTWIHFTTPHPAGYNFRVFGDGRWELTTARRVVAEGRTNPPGTGWHRLSLSCLGNELRAELDGRELVRLKDSTYQRGLVGLTSRFHPARFDDLEIRRPE